MHRQFRSLVPSLALVALSWALSSAAVPKPKTPGGLEALERITGRFSSLEAFLADKSARTQYQVQLGRMHGRNSFPCESFDQVISQIRRWIEAEPSVAERLWAPRKNWRLDVPGKERVRFTHSTQPFHDVWIDLSRAQCASTPCGPVQLGAPGRWAAVLEGSAVFHVEQGGRSSGAGIVVTEIVRGEERARMVAGSTTSVPVQAWAKAVGGKIPLVEVDSRGTLRTVVDRKYFGKATGFGYRDPLAEKLALFVPERCEKQKEGLTGVSTSGNSPSGAKPGNGVTLSTNQAALGDLLIALQMPPLGSAPSQIPKAIENGLREKLATSPDAKQRAMAGMALNLLNEMTPREPGGRGLASVGVPGFINSFSPPTRKALARALKDPSPAVRAQAALAIADSGGTRTPSPEVKAPPELVAIQPELHRALGEAYRAPAAAGVPGLPPTAQGLVSPQAISNRAFDQMLFDNVPIKPGVKDDLWKKAQEGPTPEVKVDSVSQIAHEYLAHMEAGGAAQALEDLKQRLAAQPEVYRQVLAQIDQDLVKFCKECRENNIARR